MQTPWTTLLLEAQAVDAERKRNERRAEEARMLHAELPQEPLLPEWLLQRLG